MDITRTLNLQLEQISQITQERYKIINEIGVLGGLSGIALFHFYYSNYIDDDTQSDLGVEILSHCMDKINSGYSYPTYCNGIAGFGWTLQHLVDQGFVEFDIDELLNPFDSFLQSQMKFNLDNGHFDFLHGAIGYGFYFLRRFRSSTREVNKNRYKGFLEQLVSEIERLAIYEDNTIKWESTLIPEKGTKGFNLSLSHGISSIIYLLSQLYFADITKEKTSQLIEGASNYILSLENATKTGISLYPGWVEPGHKLEYNARLSWCYGDIGVGLALKWAGQVLNKNEFIKKTEKIFLENAKKRDSEDTLVNDAGFCHGAYGNAHIFHKLFQNNKEKSFEEAAAFWIQDGLHKHTGSLHEPYKQMDTANNVSRFELSLLEGVSGIGLAMIDYLTDTRNTWDECLMLR